MPLGHPCLGDFKYDSKVVLFIIYLFIYLSVNIKPPRHRFGFSLALGWQCGIEGLLTKLLVY
jgi:hypothetical protein